ncbi:hypothetical protein TNO020_40084 [Tenacibaculum piscium]|uniref:Uncharacterized protein n=2 Tax=Tenacibaculum piscium TaxID=1458515 RepID=A0A2H1YHA7_9FLAO|nr:hypothetical protein TNO020_40084 [Tenacibaculum piscium]
MLNDDKFVCIFCFMGYNSKEAFLVTTILNKQVVLRMCLINPKTTIDHVEETLALCHQFGQEILSK